MSPLPTLSFFATTCRILIYHGRGTEQWSGGSDRAAAGSSEFKGRGGQGQDIMKRCDVGSGLWQQALGRRAWLRLAGAAALAGISRGVESDPATMHDPPARGPAEEELEQAKAAARKVTSGTLGTVQSAHFQAVGDATEPYMNQMLLDCERIALDFLWYYRSVGFQVQRPDRRLTLIIFRDEKPFFKILPDAPKNAVGVYRRDTNFFVFYDLRNARRVDSRAGRMNAITFAHETTHQLTFNTGLLNRKGDVPKCIAEGLAMYGEVPNSSGHYDPGRILYGRLRQVAAIRGAGKWVAAAELLSDDKKAQKSYDQSWLLVHFLMKHADRLPQFRAYLKTIYQRTDRNHRLEDARAHLGDLVLLDRELFRYGIELPGTL